MRSSVRIDESERRRETEEIEHFDFREISREVLKRV